MAASSRIFAFSPTLKLQKLYNFSVFPSLQCRYTVGDSRSPVCVSQRRHLYGAQYLGIESFAEHRQRVTQQFQSLQDKFRQRMRQGLDDPSPTAMVFTEDLKNMIHMCEDKPKDMDICIEMIRRFSKQNKELRFGTFTFGPVVMRLLHLLDKPDIAFELMFDQELSNFFDQLSSYLIALSLMYKSGRYDDVLKLYDQLKTKELSGTKFPKDHIVLALGACYHLNTPESFNYAKKLIKECADSGAIVLRKGIALSVALALKQKDPNTALELLSLTNQVSYITIRNLKVITLCDMNRPEDAITVIRTILERDVPAEWITQKQILKETLDAVAKAVKLSASKELDQQFQSLVKLLEESKQINDESMETLLLAPTINKPIRREGGYSRPNSDSYQDYNKPREDVYPGRQQNDFYGRDREPYSGGGRDREGYGNREEYRSRDGYRVQNNNMAQRRRNEFRQRQGLADMD